MTPIAVYRRDIRASIERIWENVLDWEHLPWLHASAFAAIEPVATGPEGWRAWVTLPPGGASRRALIDVALDRPARLYWTRTIDGVGSGTAIRTALTPRDTETTGIVVEFFVPDVPEAAAEQVGALFTTLYAQLWDEDETMMIQRTAVLARVGEPNEETARLALGSLVALRQRLPLVVELAGEPIRLVEIDGTIVPYVATCPHLGGPLTAAALAGSIVTCPWHGYRFDVRSGASADGRRLRLTHPPRLELDAAGDVWLSRDGRTTADAPQ